MVQISDITINSVCSNATNLLNITLFTTVHLAVKHTYSYFNGHPLISMKYISLLIVNIKNEA